MRRSIADFDEAIRLRPDYAAAYFSRALAYDCARLHRSGGPPRLDPGARRLRARRRAGLRAPRRNNLAITQLRLGDAGIKAARASVALLTNVSNTHQTLASLLRYDAPRPTAAYRAELRRLRQTRGDR